jgi:hypothetical protein
MPGKIFPCFNQLFSNLCSATVGMTEFFPWQQVDIIQHSQRLLWSFHHWTGRSLLAPADSPEETARLLFAAPFVVVAHGTQADPIFNYGNQIALKLWQVDWATLTQTPSRYTAEPIAREEREQLLQRGRERGYIDDYQGIRISSTGQRFKIKDVVLWNVIDEQKQNHGQAATFANWEWLSE